MSKDELIKILTELKKSSMNDENVISQINDIEKIIELKNAKEEEMLKFKEMMEEDQYKDEKSQKLLQGYLDAAQKEADFADDYYGLAEEGGLTEDFYGEEELKDAAE